MLGTGLKFYAVPSLRLRSQTLKKKYVKVFGLSFQRQSKIQVSHADLWQLLLIEKKHQI